MVKRTLSIAESEGIPLADAAVRALYADRAGDFPVNGEYPDGERGWSARDKLPRPPFRDFAVFKEGLAELRTINPSLTFWGDVDETAADWPEWVQERY